MASIGADFHRIIILRALMLRRHLYFRWHLIFTVDDVSAADIRLTSVN